MERNELEYFPISDDLSNMQSNFSYDIFIYDQRRNEVSDSEIKIDLPIS